MHRLIPAGCLLALVFSAHAGASSAQDSSAPVTPSMAAMARESADAQQTPIETGELEIRAQAVLTVTIK